MNFLAHLYLAAENDHCLAGALLGDFVKGKLIDQYQQEWLESIDFHRQIDRYTDSDLLVREAKQQFQPPYRRYAGIIVDIMFDHFLVRDWQQFSHLKLADFEQHCYQQLASDAPLFPQPAQRLTEHIINQNLLTGYGELSTVHRALEGVGRRFSRANPLGDTESAIASAYQQLEQQFHLFFPQLMLACRQQRL